MLQRWLVTKLRSKSSSFWKMKASEGTQDDLQAGCGKTARPEKVATLHQAKTSTRLADIWALAMRTSRPSLSIWVASRRSLQRTSKSSSQSLRLTCTVWPRSRILHLFAVRLLPVHKRQVCLIRTESGTHPIIQTLRVSSLNTSKAKEKTSAHLCFRVHL